VEKQGIGAQFSTGSKGAETPSGSTIRNADNLHYVK
jgi:hypothetical protein